MIQKRIGAGILATIGALSASAPARAQDSPAAPAKPPTTIIANYREADVRAVIEQLARATRTNVVIDDDVHGTITLLREKPLTADEYRAAVIATLRAEGYEVTEHDGVLRIGPRKP
jgi:general secretion pathway protein D